MLNGSKVTGQRVEKKFTPVANLVSVQVLAAKEFTKAGLVLPDTVKSRNPWETAIGRVVAVGPDCKWVKPGDFILASNETPGVGVRFGGDHLLLVAEDNILGVIDDPETIEEVYPVLN